MSTERIANFIVDTSHEQVGPEVINTAKNAVLDFLGVTLAGSPETTGKLITGYAREISGKSEAGVIGNGFKAPATIAALANGTMAHSLDYDDYNHSWPGHPTVAVLPAVLALGEKYRSSGKDVLEAYIIGFEVGAKIGVSVGKRLRLAGWHTTAAIGSIAAAAAAARLLRLNTWQVRMSLGISASMASGLAQNFGTMTKPLHAGNAARNGVLASLLAQKGFTADESILEGEQGFCRVFASGADWDSPREWVSPWDITVVGFKPYPSCRGTHASIDAALMLREKYHFVPSDIAEVECTIGPMQSQVLLFRRPQSGLQGKFSVEYCVSLALLEGEVKLKHFTDEKLSQPDVQQLLQKVKRTVPRGLEPAELEYPQTVVVKLRNGREYSHKVTYDMCKGEPKNPMTFEELSSKYRECASLALQPRNVEHVLDLVSKFESLEDISTLMEVVTFGG